MPLLASTAEDISKIIEALSGNEEIIIFGGITICVTTGLVFGMIASIFKTIARERSRREIAAYVAEGSISPEQAEKLIKAGNEEESC